MQVRYLNGGLGLVASGNRKIKPGNEYNKYFGPPKREDKYLSYAGTTGDTITKDLYYSEEAAETPEDVIFFDGINYYERSSALSGLTGLNGLNGLNGLGFLKKVWGAVKAVGKGVKKIGKKTIKKVVFKKDGTKSIPEY